MSNPSLHLWINHLPLDLGMLAMLTAFLGMLGNREDVLRVALWLFVAAGIAAGISYVSGKTLAAFLALDAETSPAFAEHRRLGYLGQASAVFTAALSGISLALYPARRHLEINRLLLGLVLTLALVGLFFSVRAFVSGKEFGHPEVLGSVWAPLQTPTSA